MDPLVLHLRLLLALVLPFATAGAETTTPVKLSNPFPPGGGGYFFQPSPGGTHVLYLADQEVDGFAQFHGLTTSFDGDEEQDHNLNVFEYLGAGHPKEPDSPLRLQAAKIDGADEFSFVLAPAVGNDIRIEIETSTDLTNTGPGAWTPIAVRENGVWTSFPVQITRLGDGLARHTLLLTTSDHRFYRLRATLAR